MKDVLRTVPLSPFAPIRSVIAKKMQENEEKNIKIVAGSKKAVCKTVYGGSNPPGTSKAKEGLE